MAEKKIKESVIYRLKTAKIKAGKKQGDTSSMHLEFDEVLTTEKGQVHITPVVKMPPFEPHQDLLKAAKMLVPHLLILTEFRESKEFTKKYFEAESALQDETLKNFKVTGIHIKEKDDNRFVVIVGRKVLSTGKVINLSPLVSLSNVEEGESYTFVHQLNTSVELFISEVEAYLGGKVAPDPQGKLFPEPAAEEAKGKMKVA